MAADEKDRSASPAGLRNSRFLDALLVCVIVLIAIVAFLLFFPNSR